MARYYSQPRFSWIEDDIHEDDCSLVLDLAVSDHEPIWSDLLDLNGDPIMRMPNPIGFGRDDQW